MWYKNVDVSICHFVTIHALDRWTDGRTAHRKTTAAELQHGKNYRSGLPIRVNCTFIAVCYGRGATSEYLLEIGVCDEL